MSLLHNPRKLSGLTLSCINLSFLYSNARLMTIHMNITQSHRLRSMLSLYLRQSDVALCSWSGGQRRRQNLGEEVEWREAKEEMPPYRLPLRLFGGLLAAQQEPAQDMERVVLIPCVEPVRHTCLPASEAHSVQTGLWLSLFIKEPPSSLQSTLSKIQTKPLYISTEGPATHFWDWAKPNIYSILYSTQMNYCSTYGEDQGI